MRRTLHNAKKRLEELDEATTDADPRDDVELDDREAAAIQRYLRERPTTDED